MKKGRKEEGIGREEKGIEGKWGKERGGVGGRGREGGDGRGSESQWPDEAKLQIQH